MKDKRAHPAVRWPREAGDKPPMPAILEPIADRACKRHKVRHANPGVAVDVEKASETGYVIGSPHSNLEAWEAMVCDALGTRSISTAKTFLNQLTALCSQNWHEAEDGGGEWCPDERELNMVLNIVSGIKPKNEMEAALAAQMVAVHLMQMKLSARALSGYVVAEDAAIASKLARTFVMQIDALSRLKGKRSSSKQTIIVRQEKHVHHHQHLHVDGDPPARRSQPHEANKPRIGGDGTRPALLSQDPTGNVLPMRRDEGPLAMSQARRGKRIRRT